MNARRRAVGLGLALLLAVHVGCSKPVPRPGVTGSVTVITPGKDGKPVPQEPATQLQSVATQQVREITHDGSTVSLLVRKTEYGRATFDVTFADKKTEMVRVKVGETKDVLPAGEKLGVRIQVQECH
jgi:hypothetical protein